MTKRSVALAAKAVAIVLLIFLLNVTAFSEGIVGFAVSPRQAAVRKTLTTLVVLSDVVLAGLLFVTMLQMRREQEFQKNMGRLNTRDYLRELKQCQAQNPHLREETARAIRQSERIQQYAETLKRILDRGSVNRFRTLLDASETAKEGVEDNTLNLINLVSICNPDSKHFDERAASVRGILDSNDAILNQLDEILGLAAQLIAKKTTTNEQLDCLIQALTETCAARGK